MEGDSAGGSAKQGRDPSTQAILPLRGKILNTERTRFDKMLANKEVKALITAMGAGIGEDDTDYDKLRYHKVVIMTDADVDGAHIRTLLLTFFFRQYQELIDRGHLYIAQPPLYRVHSSRFEKFIKDDPELNAFLLERISNDITIRTESGCAFTGPDIVSLMKAIELVSAKVRDVENIGIARELFLAFIEYETRIEPQWFTGDDPNGLRQWLADRGYSVSAEHEDTDEDSRTFVVFEDANGHRTRVGAEFFHSKMYRQAWDALADIRTRCGSLRCTVDRKGETSEAEDIFDLFRLVLDEARKGINIQRYKGLGEMNPEQLWVTTMNPENRTLLRVTVDDAEEASEAFEQLMGDRVEPRREFIERNALSVQELDI